MDVKGDNILQNATQTYAQCTILIIDQHDSQDESMVCLRDSVLVAFGDSNAFTIHAPNARYAHLH
jgi:hypothetical protein